MSGFHRRKAEGMAQQYNLGKWYALLNTILLPKNAYAYTSWMQGWLPGAICFDRIEAFGIIR